MASQSSYNPPNIAVTLPRNVQAGQTATVSTGLLAQPIIIYGAYGALRGGMLSLTGGAVAGTISFFGSGGEFDDATGAAHSYQVYGGGGVMRLTGAGSSVTLANTQNNWGTVYGDALSVNLNGAQASVLGGDNVVSFVGGAGNQASLYGVPGAWNTVQGSGGVAIVASGNASVLGSANIVFVAQGSWLSLYATQAGADQVYASGCYVILNAAAANVTGGGNAIYATGSSQIGISGTNGAWDGVFGDGARVALDHAEAAVYGGGATITANAGSGLSLFGAGALADSVTANDATLILTDSSATIVGGGNRIYTAGDCALALSGSEGGWNSVSGSGAHIVATQALLSVIGGANVISASNSFVSLYDTNGHADLVTGSNNGLALTGADATLHGSNDSIYLIGNCALTLFGANETVDVGANAGDASVAGFVASDVLHLSSANWSDFAALQSSGAMTQTGADTTIRLDTSHVLTLGGVSSSTLTAAQFAFG